jgi:uncharacterized protein (DUF433 family)
MAIMNEAVAVETLPVQVAPRLHTERPAITTNPEKLGGTPTIAGTRLPVTALIDHLLLGYDIDEFLDEFDGVERGEVQAVLLKIKEALANGWLAERVDY